MFLNQLHHKIFTTQWQTVPLWPQSLCQRSLVHLVHSFIQTELCCFLKTSRILITQFPFVAQTQIKTYHPSICFFLYRRWNSVEKIPWGRNILLFFVLFCFFRMKKKPLQTLAGSVRVCYHFCWWLGTGSQGTRRHRSFQFACAALTLWK